MANDRTTIDLGDGFSMTMTNFWVKHACGHWVDYPPEAFDAVFSGYDEDDDDGPAREPCPDCRAARTEQREEWRQEP